MNNETTTAVTAESVTAAETSAASPERSSWIKVISTSLLASLIVAVVILAFTWPTKTMEAKNLPVSIAGPEVTVSQFEQSLKDKGIETFELKQASSREEAEQQIKQRETYGAIVFTEGAAPEVLTAPAANTAATQMLNGVATQLNAQIQQKALAAKTEALTQAVQTGGEQGAQAAAQLEQMKVQAEQASAMEVKTTAVVPLSEGDSSGSGIAISAFPLVIGGILGGSFSALRVNGTWRRFVTAILYAVIGGALTALILNVWFGLIPGDFATLWAAFGATYLATASFIVGVSALSSPLAGLGLGAVVTMFIGNPISGASMPSVFLPGAWGQIGQMLVPGASSTLLRSIAYFPEVATSGQWLVLGSWIAFGLLAGVIGWALKERRTATVEA
ncbi:ABC transporter permease [Rothia sp. (in: high G+C Gram-positive bacteria)]|uniref:ABC transporter permease n=1 Tax=Rothia sp. (in: high G+C Gram-positive bacteria) TaxID=1885016 RepID=UPI0025CD8816|nr:ABC transporter permease [Rothia sp. (in: high G+C Gram-positive bacteria)]